MGFSTNITIQNDFFHEIAKDPQALVDAIQVGMNDGLGGQHPIKDTWDARDDAPDYRRRLAHKRRFGGPQGVTVHQARHNDEAQVIVNTYGTHAIAAHELPYAIRSGWLDLREYNRKHAEDVAFELHRLARMIRKEVREYDARKKAEKDA